MTDERDLWQRMPEHYLLCFNGQCELAESCLHWLATQHGNPKDEFVRAVNPRVCSGRSCRNYRPKRIVTAAFGMLHTFDNVKAKDIAAMRKHIQNYFCRSSYYVRRNGKHRISSEEQAFVSQVFRSYGYTDGATFDCYTEDFDW